MRVPLSRSERRRRGILAVLVTAVALGAVAAPAEPCGDKLLVIGRRVKRVPQAKHPASVLIYMRPDSALPRAAREMKLESTLRQAGHAVASVDRADGLRLQLSAGGYDFVLTDPTDAAPVTRQTGSGPGTPEVVPVAYKAGESVLRELQQTYAVVIQAGRSLSYLAALDTAMRRRVATGTKR